MVSLVWRPKHTLLLEHLRGFSVLATCNGGAGGQLAGDDLFLSSFQIPLDLKPSHSYCPLPLLGIQQRELQDVFLSRSYKN